MHTVFKLECHMFQFKNRALSIHRTINRRCSEWLFVDSRMQGQSPRAKVDHSQTRVSVGDVSALCRDKGTRESAGRLNAGCVIMLGRRRWNCATFSDAVGSVSVVAALSNKGLQ